MPYAERLALLDLELLEVRRLKADMYFCFKILNNLTALDKNIYFTTDIRNISTRNYDNSLLMYNRSSCNRSDNLFFNRCVAVWNSLCFECRNADSLTVFKDFIEMHDFTNFLKGRA